MTFLDFDFRRNDENGLLATFYQVVNYNLYRDPDMKTTVFDLKYKIKDVLKALDRRETIQVFYQGQLKGTIIPVSNNRKIKMADHPFFGMKKREHADLPELMDNLRRVRY